MNPSSFTKQPYGSVATKSEAETVARNIMVILSRTGDKWREISWGEYESERQNDGNFIPREQPYFDQVIGYCRSAETAALFSPVWAEVED